MRERFTPHQTGVGLAAFGMLVVSLDSPLIRLADVDSWTVAFWFGVFVAGSTSAILIVRDRVSPLAVVRADGLPTLVSALLQTGSTTFFIIAITLTAVANVVVIVAATPLVAALLAWLIIRERASLKTWAAIGISICGILIVVSGSVGGGNLRGDLTAVLAILSFGLNLVLWRRHPTLNLLGTVGLAGVIMAIIALPLADPGTAGRRSLLVLFVMGAVLGPLGRISIATATRYIPTALVSLFAPIETVAATIWAWLFLSETPPVRTILGGVIVVAAVVFGTRASPRVLPLDH